MIFKKIFSNAFAAIINLTSKVKNIFVSSNAEIYDLSKPITIDTPVFPGDPPFKVEQIQSLNNESSYNLFYMHLCNHMGTHIDFPAHVIPSGKTSEQYTLKDLMGKGIVIEVPEQESTAITENFVRQQSIQKNDIVFFKTSNSKLPEDKLSEKYVYLTSNAAEELLKKQVKMVGIDYLSIDALEEEKLPTHKKLLGAGILIVENLNLKDIPAGRYNDIAVLPPNIPKMDGLPVRAFARNI